MAARTGETEDRPAESATPVAESPVNEVRLVGRVSVDPERRELPSGDPLVSLRLVVDRPPGDQRSRQRIDALECAVWSPRVQRTVMGWKAGDRVEVHGSLRRRFFRTGAGTASRVEVEVLRARITRRSRSG